MKLKPEGYTRREKKQISTYPSSWAWELLGGGASTVATAAVECWAQVLAEATLVKVEGRRLVFTVSAARLEGDGGGLVGAGRVTRVVVDRSTFLARAGATGPS